MVNCDKIESLMHHRCAWQVGIPVEILHMTQAQLQEHLRTKRGYWVYADQKQIKAIATPSLHLINRPEAQASRHMDDNKTLKERFETFLRELSYVLRHEGENAEDEEVRAWPLAIDAVYCYFMRYPSKIRKFRDLCDHLTVIGVDADAVDYYTSPLKAFAWCAMYCNESDK